MKTYEDNRNLITSVENKSGTNLISKFEYSNDAIGRRTRRIDQSDTGIPACSTNNFGYNTRSELISALMSTNSFAYDYDQIGNRELARINANTNTYLSNELNQYTNISYGQSPVIAPQYDSDGNLTNYNGWTYSWNGENRLIMASNGTTVVQYAYDYMGRRFSKIVHDGTTATTNYYVYDGWNLIAETLYGQSPVVAPSTNYYTWGLDLSGTLQGVPLRQGYGGHAGGIGGLLSVTECSVGSTNQYFPVADGNGNITEYVTTNGTVAAHYEYNPFGGTITSSGTKANDLKFRFSTKYLDDETGLYYYAYRYYSSELGRWINRDPILEMGFIYSMKYDDYINRDDVLEDEHLNNYAFVINSSLNYYDLLGLSLAPSCCDSCEDQSLDALKYGGCVAGCMLTGDATGVGATFLGLYKLANMKNIPKGAAGKAKRKARKMAQKQLRRLARKLGMKSGGKLLTRWIPGLGWALVAYDAASCSYRCSQNCDMYDCSPKTKIQPPPFTPPSAPPNDYPYEPPYSGGTGNIPPVVIF